jgi:hypothetical protein
MKRLQFSSVFVAMMLLLLCHNNELSAQKIETYPSNWFVQMKWNKVQVLFRSTSMDLSKASISTKYAGVTVQGISHFKNSHYVVANVFIASTAKAGDIQFVLNNGVSTETVTWTLKPRRPGKGTSFAQGVNQSDFIYFLMPDRFSNGEASNDRLPGLKDQTLNRDSIYHRHGGDLQGDNLVDDSSD